MSLNGVDMASWFVMLHESRWTNLRELNKGNRLKNNIVIMGFMPPLWHGDFLCGGTSDKTISDPKDYVWTIRCLLRQPFLGGRSPPIGSLQWISFSSIASMKKESLVTSPIARPFSLLMSTIRDALHVEPKAHVFKKRSLIAMGVVMDIGGGTCCCSATRQVGEEDEVEEAANEEAGGSAEGTEI
ncbi:hypothetical protein Tco_0401898 [Tanacetum coccineum]